MPGTDLFSRLAHPGEEAITRLAKMPGGEQLVGAMNATRERVDELQRRVPGLEDVEKGGEALEKEGAERRGGGGEGGGAGGGRGARAPARRAGSSSSARSAAARSRATTPKPP